VQSRYRILNEQDVTIARQMYEAGQSLAAIGEHFGVADRTVLNVSLVPAFVMLRRRCSGDARSGTPGGACSARLRFRNLRGSGRSVRVRTCRNHASVRSMSGFAARRSWAALARRPRNKVTSGRVGDAEGPY